MYYHIQSIKNQFKHNCNSKLLFGVAVADSRAILFYANGMFFDYQLSTKKILYSSNLGQRPFKAASINPYQIICLLSESKSLISINLRKKTIVQLLKLPLIQTKDEFKDRNLFYSTNLCVFMNSGAFYVQQTNQQQNKKRIRFYLNSNQMIGFKQFDYNNCIFQKIDERSLMVIYKQKIQIQNLWQFRIINLADSFYQTKYIIEHKSFNSNNIVAQVIIKNQYEILIFLNGPNPQILLFGVQKNQIRQFQYKPNINFKNICFYNHEKQIACFVYLANVRINGQLYQNLLELVNMEKKVLMDKIYVTLKDYSIGWGFDYLLDIPAEYKPGNLSIFHTRHFIKKKSLYFNILYRSGYLKRFGEQICHHVLELLQ